MKIQKLQFQKKVSVSKFFKTMLIFLNNITLKKAIFWLLYTLYIHKREITKESYNMLPNTNNTKNDTNGNGQFGTLIRKRTKRKSV